MSSEQMLKSHVSNDEAMYNIADDEAMYNIVDDAKEPH